MHWFFLSLKKETTPLTVERSGLSSKGFLFPSSCLGPWDQDGPESVSQVSGEVGDLLVGGVLGLLGLD